MILPTFLESGGVIMQKDIVVNENNQTNIEYISIYRLFNHYNIKLPFEKMTDL